MTALFSRLGKRLCAFGRRRVSSRALGFLCAAWVVFLLAPLFALCFFAHPVHDDFPHTIEAAAVWAGTGSLTAVLQAAWERMVLMYETWQGTFVAMFFSAFQPMVFSAKLFWLAPFTTLLLLVLSMGYFVKQLVMRTLDAGRAAAMAVYAALLTLLLEYMPGAREALYWQSGTPYTLSMIALFFLLGLLLKLHMPQRRGLYAWRSFAALLCGVVLGGCPYPLALGGAVGVGLVMVWCFLRRSPARLGSVLAFLGVAGALLVVVLAPGNAVRQARVGESMGPVRAVIQSLSECLQTTGEWVSPQLLAVCLLLVPLLWQPLKQSEVSFRYPGWFSLFSFGVLAASFVPPIYATGVDGYRVERVLASLYMLFSLLAVLNILYWTGYLAKRHALSASAQATPVWRLVLCASLVVWGLFSCAILATPTASSYLSLVNGNAARYHSEMSAREHAIAAAETPAEARAAIAELTAHPAVLPADMLVYQTESSLPQMMHRYYRIQELMEQYGAGQIPDDEWEALDAWTQGE